MIIRNIKKTEASTNLNVAFILINAVDDEAYALAKFHLKGMENLTLIHTKERLKIVEQRIKNDQGTDEVANKMETKGKYNRECYYCKKRGHIKWLATDEGKKYAEEQAKKPNQSDAPETKPANQKEKKGSSKRPDRSAGNARTTQEEKGSDSDEAWIAIDRHVDPNEGWVIDSGATRHMTPDESVFITKRVISSTVDQQHDHGGQRRPISRHEGRIRCAESGCKLVVDISSESEEFFGYVS